MSSDKTPQTTSEGLRKLRERLEKITEIKTVSPERVIERTDDKADDEASAIANKSYDDIERDHKKAKVQSIVENNLDSRVNRRLRWKYATWVFCYLVCYSVFVGIILILSAWKICDFDIEASVLEFLVGSTAAAAIGLVYAVTHGLFTK